MEVVVNSDRQLIKSFTEFRVISCQRSKPRTTCCKNFKKDRTDQSFDLWWETILQKKNDSIAEPFMPRQKKSTLPSKYLDYQSKSAEVILSPKNYYKRIYLSTYDFAINTINDRFDQPDFIIYRCLQDVLLKCVGGDNYDAELSKVEEMYSDEVNMNLLKSQLLLMKTMAGDKDFNIKEIIAWFKSMKKAEKHYYLK